MALVLPEPNLRILQSQGRQAFPYECCGFLIGETRGAHRHAIHVRPAINTRRGDDGRTQYRISPEEYIAADASARDLNLDIVGFYHSHPGTDAIPSACDIENAWPWFSYLILSVHDEEPGVISSWILRADRSGFDPEEITVDDPTELTIG